MGGASRGWGGVLTTAVAAACALTVTAVLVPLVPDGGGAARAAAGDRPATVEQARYALAQSGKDTRDQSADDCAPSLRPTSGTLDGAAVERIKSRGPRGRLLVGVDQDSYLWGYRNPSTGALDGFDIDIVKAIATGILGPDPSVQYLNVPTSERFAALKDHKVDMVVRTTSIDCSPGKRAAYSIPYFPAGMRILAPKDSPITGFDDSLKGRRVCTADGSTSHRTLTNDPHGAVIVTPVANQLDCLVELQLGLADAVFTDEALAAGLAAQDPEVHLVGQLVHPEPYGVAMNPDDQDLVRKVNQILEQYKSGGRYSKWMQSYDQWLAKDLPGITGPPKSVYQ